MKHTKVGTVMAHDVITAEPNTGSEEVARLLDENRISGLPVIDNDEKVLGIVSETDLLLRRAAGEGARTAGMLMSAPAVTVHADETIVAAARTMARRRIERLPVLDEEDRLVGIVTRRDVLQVFLRPDADILREVVQDVIVDALLLAPQTLDVRVEDGVVTLTGQVGRRSEKPVALYMTRQVDGVVRVIDQLTHRVDDSRRRPAGPAPHGIGEPGSRTA